MKDLIIDGANLGPVTGYRQNRERSQWVFLMRGGYSVAVDFGKIKRFDSAENLEIVTEEGRNGWL